MFYNSHLKSIKNVLCELKREVHRHESKIIKQLKMRKCWQEKVVRYEACGAKNCKVDHVGHAFIHSSSVSALSRSGLNTLGSDYILISKIIRHYRMRLSAVIHSKS